MKKKEILLIISIFLVVLILFSSSYALLFKSDQTDKQSYATGVLSITSEATNNSVTLNNALPMSDTDGASSTPYTFKITNTGNLSYKFNVMLLSTTTENQISAEYIKVKVNDNAPVKLNSLTNGVILSNITLKPEAYVEISLRVWLDESTPNTEIGKSFNAKITTEGEAVYVESPAKETLTKLGLTESSDTPDFSKTSCSSGCEESTVGIYSAEDDLGTSYYFRGDVENNYVYFAGFYWRIIRINGDGSIRIIYDGTSAHDNGESSTDRQIGTSAFNSKRNRNTYVGYMYGSTGATTYAETHANTNNSTIKSYLDIWYDNNIKNTLSEGYIEDAIYCNDRELYSGTGIDTTETEYMPNNRIIPSLKCNQVNDRFSKSTGIDGAETNGMLSRNIGLITYDEIKFAGNISDKTYLYNGNGFWTMTPLEFSSIGSASSAYVGVFNYDSDGIFIEPLVTTVLGVRPVISISGTALFSGTGTKTDPYKINVAKHTLTNLGLTESNGTPDFSKTSCSSGCGESTVGIYKAEDDFGDSYYFRGDVENNYVYFANYYWRIIRINGDGSIRMIYDGTRAYNNGLSYVDRYISTLRYNYIPQSVADYRGNASIGYMYGTVNASTYDEEHANTNDSAIKQKVDEWYNTNVKNTINEQYVVDAIYCNDRELSSGTGIGTTDTTYKTYYRIRSNTLSLKCVQVNDRFTKNGMLSNFQGNGKLTNSIGLITADEVIYAGGGNNVSNLKYYLFMGYPFWTMSPNETGTTFYVNDDSSKVTGVGLTSISVSKTQGVRPVISISGTALNSGTGTRTDPFKIS